MSGGEMVQALRTTGVSQEEIARPVPSPDATEAAYEVRWRGVSEALTDMNVQALEAEVLWGSMIPEALKPLRTCIGELKASVWSHVRAQRHSDDDKQSAEQQKRLFAVLYELFDKPEEDAFFGELQSAVQKVEVIMRPHLK